MEVLAKVLYNGRTVRDGGVKVCIEGDRISDIVADKSANTGYITPAFIDAHSHIGLDRQSEPMAEGETNDVTNQIQPLLDPLNSVYFDDSAFIDTVNWGVLYSCIVPGSGNVLGGKAVIIRNFARNRKTALIKYYGYKMALGFNPRLIESSEEWKGDRPNTRMGVYSLLESKFDSLLLKQQRAHLEKNKALLEDENNKKTELIHQEYELSFNPEDRALLELLNGSVVAKVHVHKIDDIYYLIGLAKKYNLKISAEHLCDVNDQQVFRDVADAGMQIVYGPLGSFDYKTELKNSSYKNAALLMQSGVKFGLMTDHPVVMSYCFRDQLKYFLINGMSKEKALSLVTLDNARILGMDNDLGTVEPGKLASFVVWNKDPFDLSSVPTMVCAEGKMLNINCILRQPVDYEYPCINV